MADGAANLGAGRDQCPTSAPGGIDRLGGALLLGGAIAAKGRVVATSMTASGAPMQVSYQGPAAISGLEILVGFAVIILGILALLFETSGGRGTGRLHRGRSGVADGQRHFQRRRRAALHHPVT
jgi:hypothetical protein